MAMNQYQKEAAEFYLSSKKSILVRARGGSGKTSWLLALSKPPKSKSAIYVSFTNAAKDEILRRDPGLQGQVKTIYQLGMAACRKLLGDVRVESWKYQTILRDLLKTDEYTSLEIRHKITPGFYATQTNQRELDQRISLCLVNLLWDIDSISTYLEHEYFANPVVEAWLISRAILIGHRQAVEEGVISFSDMISFPFSPAARPLKTPGVSLFTRWPIVFLDEAQDCSEAQLRIVQETVGKGQLVSIGDNFQCIYQFAGAAEDSLERIRVMFGCKEFTFPICYRCGDTILKEVHHIVPDIQGTGKPSTVGWLNDKAELYDFLENTKKDTLVLARVNRLLFTLALDLMDRNIPFCFAQANLGETIKGKVKTLQSKVSKFSELSETLNQELKTAEEYRNYKAAETLECIQVILKKDKPQNYPELYASIRGILYSPSADIRLSSVHASKGAEADNVVIFGDDYFPHPRAHTEAQLRAEKNLEYVAKTRAKTVLKYMDFTDYES